MYAQHEKGQSLWPGQSVYGTPSICTPITTTALEATISVNT